MHPPHWPRRRVGLGEAGTAEFNAIVQNDPQAAAAWQQVVSQIKSEASITGQLNAAAPIAGQVNAVTGGAVAPVLDAGGNVINAGGAALQETISRAQQQFASSFDQIASNPEIAGAISEAGSIYDAAKKYAMVGETIAGAAMTIDQLVQRAESALSVTAKDALKLQTFQAFTGTMMSALAAVGLATGVETAGIGAAVCAIVAIGVQLLEAAIGSPPPAPAGGYSFCCNFVFNQVPDWTVGGLGVWGTKNAPNSKTWRPFPNPNDPEDAAWFAHQAGAGTWLGAHFGWGGTGNGGPNEYTTYDYGSEFSAWGDDRSSHGWFAASPVLHQYGGGGPPLDRPIDNAFPSCAMPPKGLTSSQWSVFPSSMYSTVCESAAGFTLLSGIPGDKLVKLSKAYVEAWKVNAAYALNGLQPAPDWVVLTHLLNFWNKAHAGPMVAIPTYDSSMAQGAASYLGYVVNDAIQNGSDLAYGNGLGVNVGDPYPITPLGSGSSGAGDVIQLSLPGASPAGMSTGTKVAVGAAVVGGAALLGTAGYATWKGVSLGTFLKGLLR